MDNQHRLIQGYRDLNQDDIDRINEIKTLGQQVGDLFDQIANDNNSDKRCAAIAKTKAQEAFMWVIRSVTQPRGFA